MLLLTSPIFHRPTIAFSNDSEYVRRMIEWFNLPVGKRKSLDFTYELEDMCADGEKMFEKFCFDPNHNSDFLIHISLKKKLGGCMECRSSFLHYLWLVTNESKGIHE